MKTFAQYTTEATEKHDEYVKSLQLKLTDAELTEKQLKDLVKRSNGLPNSPAVISAKADVQAMNPKQLQQVIAQKRLSVFLKHTARMRLSGKWE